MHLVRYAVTTFRSVEDSGWIEADGVTALIGENESGKTNLLLPLWKLNPAREGEIQPTSDYPKTRFGEIRASPKDYSFVTADFATGTSAATIAELAGIAAEGAELVRVKRYYDGRYEVSFPKRSGETGAALAALPDTEGKEGVVDAVVKALPKFVYYSNYGNLDSEIYLPHVVQNLERSDLGATEAAKARTLRVLFKFVRLEAQEILELGRDFKDPQNPNREPTSDEIAVVAEKKRVRSILLQSAGSTLTGKFKNWWKQGDYRFRFEADGNHFRIWVSDDRRPDEVELESRSSGLQWFLSFYLVFLGEPWRAQECDPAS